MNKSSNLSLKSALILLLLVLAAFLSLFLMPSVLPNLSNTFTYGFASEAKLNIANTDYDHGKPLLIVAAFEACAYTCPANMQTIKEIKQKTGDALNLGVIDITGEQSQEYARKISEFTGFDAKFIPDNKLLKEHIQRSSEGAPEHAGNLYLYFASSNRLLTYTVPSAESIDQDIKKIKERENS
ncbi:hypothetical protein [Methylophaga sp.]|uniref:hypothetical protein n=1 Tax=Methylophaga sp. TaxID=2024840 RepID=UPI003F696BCD